MPADRGAGCTALPFPPGLLLQAEQILALTSYSIQGAVPASSLDSTIELTLLMEEGQGWQVISDHKCVWRSGPTLHLQCSRVGTGEMPSPLPHSSPSVVGGRTGRVVMGVEHWPPPVAALR